MAKKQKYEGLLNIPITVPKDMELVANNYIQQARDTRIEALCEHFEVNVGDYRALVLKLAEELEIPAFEIKKNGRPQKAYVPYGLLFIGVEYRMKLHEKNSDYTEKSAIEEFIKTESGQFFYMELSKNRVSPDPDKPLPTHKQYKISTLLKEYRNFKNHPENKLFVEYVQSQLSKGNVSEDDLLFGYQEEVNKNPNVSRRQEVHEKLLQMKQYYPY